MAGKHIAFGVQPNQRATYELRQSRYEALATTVLDEARAIAKRAGQRRVELLDVGVFNGISLQYLEPRLGGLNIGFSGVDIFPRGKEFVYRSACWTLHEIDLEHGMPEIASESYDIVICEQVLEHLHDVRPAIEDLYRVARPGGLIVVGVPIFPLGLHQLRHVAVRVVDYLWGTRKRGHVQAWSLRSFLREFDSIDGLQLECARGFRIISGGILRPLEFTRWWWKANRWIGAQVPSLCIEVQVLLRKDNVRVVDQAA